jgi:hypothetical protein
MWPYQASAGCVSGGKKKAFIDRSCLQPTARSAIFQWKKAGA